MKPEQILAVHISPRAPRDEIVGEASGAIKIKLRAPPVDDKANAALIRFLAERLAISRVQIEIVSGRTARRKLVRVRGVSAERIAKLKDPQGFCEAPRSEAEGR